MINEIDSLVLKYSSILDSSRKSGQTVNAPHEEVSMKNNEKKIEQPRIIQEADLKQISDDINRLVTSRAISNMRVELHFNEEINRIIITVYNKDNNEIVREIPCKELQNLAMYLKEAVGLIFDNKV
jgi:flagellar protein FlaG